MVAARLIYRNLLPHAVDVTSVFFLMLHPNYQTHHQNRHRQLHGHHQGQQHQHHRHRYYSI